jgi:hypothetical protein
VEMSGRVEHLLLANIIQERKGSRYKHSSLFIPAVNDEEKSFITLKNGPNVIKVFYGRNLRIF